MAPLTAASLRNAARFALVDSRGAGPVRVRNCARQYHDDAAKGPAVAAVESVGEKVAVKQPKDAVAGSELAPAASLASDLVDMRTREAATDNEPNASDTMPTDLREGADSLMPGATEQRPEPRPRRVARTPPKDGETKFYTDKLEEVSHDVAQPAKQDPPKRQSGRRRAADFDGSVRMPGQGNGPNFGGFPRGSFFGAQSLTPTSISLPTSIASPLAIPLRGSSGPTSLGELFRSAGPPTPPDDIARRMIAGGSSDPLVDKEYPINEGTWEELRSLLTALTDEALVALNVVEKLPSVSSGIISLSAPYPGSELYLRHLAKKLASEVGADFITVWNHDVFPRLAPLTVLQNKIDSGDNGRSSSSRRGSRRDPGSMVLAFGTGPRSGAINLFAAEEPSNEDASNPVPYPWFRAYVDSQGDMTSFYHSKPPSPQQPAYHLLDQLQAFFNTLSHTSPLGVKRPRGPQRSVITGERLPNTLPPLVVLYEDFSDLLLRQREDAMGEGEIVQALMQVIRNLRRQNNGRNIVVLVPHTPTFSQRPKGDMRPGFDPASMFGRRRGAQGEEDPEEDEDEPPTRMDEMMGRKRKRPITFDTPFDRYLGIAKVEIMPPMISRPGSLTGARINFPLFSKMIRQDMARVVAEWNEREIRTACKHAGVELPFPAVELVELILDGQLGGDKERTGKKIFEERCLTMPEVEKVVALAMGFRARGAKLEQQGSTVTTEEAADKVKATGLAAVRAHTLDAPDMGKFLHIASKGSIVREAARLGSGGEHAEAFKDPNDRLRLDSYEERLLRECFVQPSKLSASFSSVGGIARTKQIVQELIQLPLQRPELFSTGILKQTTTGILLFGPPGTGKTLLARAVAAEAGANFLNVQMSHLQAYYVGENEKNVQALFRLARKLAPCVIFVDEIDALLKSRRGGALPNYAVNTINEFMLEWDGIQNNENHGVIVVGATNRPFDLDDAVLRRLPRRILVDLPDEGERREILEILLKEEQVGDTPEEREQIIAAIAARTDWWSGSDLKNLALASAMNAIREQILGKPTHETKRVLHLSHFEKAIAAGDVVPSVGEKGELVKELKQWDKQFGSAAVGFSGNFQLGYLVADVTFLWFQGGNRGYSSIGFL